MQLAGIEQSLGVRYPASFREALSEFAVLCRTDPFQGKLIASHQEVVDHQIDLPGGLLPFMKAGEADHSDIYTFALHDGSECPVVAWSGDAIVGEWKDFETFVAWLKDWLAKPTP